MTEDPLNHLRYLMDETMDLHQLNWELLDVLAVLLEKIMTYCEKANIPLDESMVVLIRKAKAIYDDIHSTSKPNLILQRKTPADETLHGYRNRRRLDGT